MSTIHRARSLLTREPDFTRLLMAQWVGQAADGMAQAAFFALLVLDPLEQKTPNKILALSALTLLPYSVIAPFLGVLVDRWSRRALLVGTNTIRGVLLLTLPLWSHAFPG